MKCLSCGYEPTLAEAQRSPKNCPKCGSDFQERSVVSPKDGWGRDEQVKPSKVSAASLEVREALLTHPGAKPVVVVDIDMPFWSMVRFMIKWTIATLPALIILALLVWGGISLLGSVARLIPGLHQ